MKRYFFLLTLAVAAVANVMAQDDTAPKKKKGNPYPNFDFKNRANDHFLLQLGYDGWSGYPEDIQFKGVNRHFNTYVMYDMPFKTNPQWSAAIGVGVGSSNIYFDKTQVDLAGKLNSSSVTFSDRSDTTNFKKYKLNTTYLEAPVELRWVANPMNSNKSFKVALGVKVGTLVSAATKGKNLQSSSGSSLYGTKYIMKEKDKKFVNGTKFAGTLRVGYGNFAIHGQYSILPVFKTAVAPEIRPWSIGITLSGL